MDLQYTLMDHAVLQRNGSNESDHPFKGSASAAGAVLLTVRKDNSILSGFENVEIGSAARGKLTGCIKGLPTGGPYTLELKIAGSREKSVVKDVLVGDLWLLAGQSNMADSGFMPSMSESNAMVHAFYMNNSWNIAKDPLHDLTHAAAPVHGGNPANPRTKFLRGTGPGLPFGIEMYKNTGVPQGLIACAHGGTSLEQWDPALKKDGGNSLYGALYERLQMLGGKVAGLLWYQGCNETGSDEKAAAYERTTRKLFAAFRRDCKNPKLPIVLAQLAGNIHDNENLIPHTANWFKVRRAQYNIGQKLPFTACVPTIDLELDDIVHLSNRAVNILGKRFAAAMLRLQGNENMPPEISVASVRCVLTRPTQTAEVIIKFKNVQGSLQAGGLPTGFAIVNDKGEFINQAVNCRLEGDTAIVQTNVSYFAFVRSQRYLIAYGAELQPNANITDSAGRSLPCFAAASAVNGNLRITEMLEDALLSEPISADDSFEALKLPENLDKLAFHKAAFSGFYLPVPRSGALERDHRVFVYKFRARASEDMKVHLLMGSDAPFLIYWNGQEIGRFCTGNPVIPDEFKIPLELAAGEHDFMCVFSGNGGCGWGICCRMQRLDGKVLPEFVNICQSDK